MLSRFERFSYAILSIYKSWHKIASDVMETFNLKGTYAIYLVTMANNPEGITAAQLCEICSRDKADVSRAVTAMEQQGIIAKTGSRYRALLKLTDSGMEVARQIRLKADVAVELAGREFTDEQRAVLYSVLETISVNLQSISADGLPE